jgi:hypothetical protein
MEAGFAYRVRLHHPAVMYPFVMDGANPEAQMTTDVQVDQGGVTCGESSVRWAYLTGVRIVTTTSGPADTAPDKGADGIFWLLYEWDGRMLWIPDARAVLLLERLRRLPRFNTAAVMQATESGAEASFVVWEGKAGEAEVCGPQVWQSPLSSRSEDIDAAKDEVGDPE